MASTQVNACIGSQNLIPATAISGVGTLTYDINGLHALGTQGSEPPLGIIFIVNIASFSAGTLTVTISGLSASGFTWTILTSAALGANATTALSIGAGITAASNTAVSALVPPQIQVAAAAASTPSFTYTIDYSIAG